MERIPIDGNKVKELRKKFVWSQEKLSEESKVSTKTIQRIENGGNCNPGTIKSIARAFCVNEQFILELSELEVSSEIFSLKIESFKRRNPYEHLYDWIIGLKDNGLTFEEILETFEEYSETKLNRNDLEEVELVTVLIKHALGQIPDSAIHPYCYPTDVLDFKPIKEVDEGLLFEAISPIKEDNFYFLVDRNISDRQSTLDELHSVLRLNLRSVCQAILLRAHTGCPCEISDPAIKMALTKLTWRDTSIS